MNYPTMHNDPVYESIQQNPGLSHQEYITSWSHPTTSGDQQGGVKIVENNNQEQGQMPASGADWEREYPTTEVDGTYIRMNSVGNLSIST